MSAINYFGYSNIKYFDILLHIEEPSVSNIKMLNVYNSNLILFHLFAYSTKQLLTVTIKNPRQQITKVFHKNCIRAIYEKRVSISADNAIILWCRRISVLIVVVRKSNASSFEEISSNPRHIISIWPPTWRI